MIYKVIFSCVAGLFLYGVLSAQSIYFPPVSASEKWETVSPDSLGWSSAKLNELYNFLQNENSKAFIVLKDGKIVLEKYFGTFTADSSWYWASAGKTITSFLVGKAQEEKFLSINDLSSKYLGSGWTSCTAEQENKISIRHQLSMTTGLNDLVTDNHCTTPDCLQYLADAGTRWAYHNAPYTLLEKVLENATVTDINVYTQTKLKAKTGMSGLWFMVGEDNVFFSTARSMARFGLLAQSGFVWNSTPLINDTLYVRSMTSTSQTLNNSYGYLWWLNGKESFMLPQLQYVFQGSYAPDAPNDMVAGLGKNGQIVSVSPSLGLVVVRMGNQPSSPASDIAPELCNQIWKRLLEAIDNNTDIPKVTEELSGLRIGKNEANDSVFIRFSGECNRLIIFDLQAKPIYIMLNPKSPCIIPEKKLQHGTYVAWLKSGNTIEKKLFIF